MKIRVVAFTIVVTTLGLIVPVTAQIRNPSQDFFEQGREQLEREIQILQTEPFTLEGNLEASPSEPALEVSPSPVNSPNENPNEEETPSQQSDEVDNQE
ncbi:MAG: hypothetical protein Fur006_08640 [Coleofasciculaceae cyanobacterium]